MTILLKKTRGLLATILCIILLAANVLLVSADSEGDSGGAQQLEAGYIFESPTEEGKDIFIQLGEEGDELSEAVLETEELSQKQIVSGEVIGNVAAFHVGSDARLIQITGLLNGNRFVSALEKLDTSEGIETEETAAAASAETIDITSYVVDGTKKSETAITETLESTGQLAVSAYDLRSGVPVVVIDPGHSKASSGTYKTWDGIVYHEEDLTMKIASYLKTALESYGNVKVYLTRDEFGTPSIYERVKYASDLGAALLVSVHLNAAGTVNDTTTTANGVEAMVAKIGTYHTENAQKGQNLASVILKQLISLGFKDRGFVFKMGDETYEDGSQADYYGIVRYGQQMNVPSIIVEHGFLNNEHDFRTYLSTEEGLKSLGEADARGIAEYLGLEQAKEGWNTDGNGCRFYVQNGKRLIGWQTIESAVYYFDSDGLVVTGTPLIDGKKYWFDGMGVQQIGWLTMSGMSLYFDESDHGAAVVGAKEIGGVKYLFDENGVKAEGTSTPVVNGKKYYLVDGIIQMGWLQLGSWQMYFDPDDNGAAVTGMKVIDGNAYNFDSNGILIPLKAGMHVVDGRKYYVLSDGSCYSGWLQLTSDWRLYFDPADGFAAATGIRKIGTDTYYFDDNGVMRTSVMPVVNGNKYYFKENGKMHTGWLQLTADWRLYFDLDTGVAATGFCKIKGENYYFDMNGVMCSGGMTVINGKKYIAQENGILYTGWLQLTADWRLYFDPSDYGAAATGFRDIAGKTYYFDSNGIMQTYGMPIIHGTKYMVNPDGSIYKGWLQLTADWRLYCDPEHNGAIATGFRKIYGHTYYFDANGIMMVGFATIDGKRYCFSEDGVMYASGTPLIDGKKYGFGSDGQQIFGWYVLGSFQIYFDSEDNGAAVVGYKQIGNMLYQFYEDGVLISSEVQYVVMEDPANGKTYTLESTFITDPQIGTDITEDEFFAAVVYAESGNQGFAGQVATALTILNRVESSSFPDTLSFEIGRAHV